MKRFINGFRVGCDTKCLLDSLPGTIFSVSVPWVSLDYYQDLVLNFLHLHMPRKSCWESDFNICRIKEHKIVILNF